MKKLLSIFLLLAMLLSLAACSDFEEAIQDVVSAVETAENLYAETSGSAETLGTEAAIETDISRIEGSESASPDEIVQFVTEGADQETTDAAEDTVATETVPVESEEDELPVDLFVTEVTTPAVEPAVIDENGIYTSKEDVALYLYTYGKLPNNFITKKEAQALGWPGGSLEPYAPGKCIGGDRFGNYEGLLPTNHKYTECDIDTLGAKSRGAKRIVFSNDCSLIYYTDDHYESFTLLYGEE